MKWMMVVVRQKPPLLELVFRLVPPRGGSAFFFPSPW